MLEDGRSEVVKTKGQADGQGDPNPKIEKDAVAGGPASPVVDGGADRLPGGAANVQSVKGPPDAGGSGDPKPERQGEPGGEASEPIAADVSVPPGSHGES